MAITLIEKQTNKLVQNLIEYTIKQKSKISLYDLNLYRAKILEAMRNFQSIFQAYKMPTRSGDNIYNIHKRNLIDISSDFEVINDTINELYNLVESINEITNINDIYKQNILSQLEVTADKIRANINSSAYIYSIDFSDIGILDPDQTTALVDNKNRQCKSKEISNKDILYFGDYQESDIALTYRGNYKLAQAKYGLLSNVVKRGEYNAEVEFIVDQSQRADTQVFIDIPVAKNKSAKSINNISLITKGFYTEFSAKFYVSKDGENYIPISNYIPNVNNNFNLHFKNELYKYVRIELKKSLEDTRTGNRFTYRFGIKQIAIRNSGFSTASTLVTKGLIKKDVNGNNIIPRRVSIDVNDFVPNDTDILYYIKRIQDLDWKSITPTNKANAANNIIEFGKNTQYSIDDIVPTETNSLWSDIRPNVNLGNVPLYNILAKVNDEENEDLHNILVDSNSDNDTFESIVLSNGEIIDPNSVELKRGKNDYSLETNPVPIDGQVDFVKYALTYGDIINLFVRLEGIPYEVNHEGYIFLGDYEIINSEFIEVYYNGKKLRSIEYNSNDNSVKIPSYTSGSIVYVSFNSSISSIEEVEDSDVIIDQDSIVISNTITRQPYNINNFEIDLSNFVIGLQPNNAIPQSSDGDYQVYVSFSYSIVKRNKGVFYKTIIENKEEIKVKMIPFTTKEKQLGNFHRIDGLTVSDLNYVDLAPGKHTIETTQPYPNDPTNPNDVNKYTGQNSRAGFLLPDGIIQYALELPQRRASLFNLANVVNIQDHRSFAVEDGKVWLNRIPVHIPQYILNDNIKNHVIGEELYGKKALYLNGKFDGYVSIPETFTLNFGSYKEDDAENDDNFILLKAEMLLKNGNTEITPLINEIAVKFL